MSVSLYNCTLVLPCGARWSPIATAGAAKWSARWHSYFTRSRVEKGDDAISTRPSHCAPLKTINNTNISKTELRIWQLQPQYITMSSPGHRRQRSSQGATPRRTARNSSQALPSSPPPADDPAAAQLQVEHMSSQTDSLGQRTPRGARTGIQSSSPLNFRSSPALGGNAYRDVSSPLRQMSNTQTTEDGDRTPRASGQTPLMGGR